jgi:WD40 repeat protein
MRDRWSAERVVLVLCLMAVALAVMPARGWAEVRRLPERPVLRIDPGTHSAPINRLAVSRDCSLIVSGAVDKTLQLWSVPPMNTDNAAASDTAALRRVDLVRPPIDSGFEGRIYSVALSPDETTIAFGGWFENDTQGSYWIYVYDRLGKKLKSALGPLPNRALRLAYSVDGRQIAATLKLGYGVWVFDATDGHVIAADAHYDSEVDAYGIAFDAKGALFTTATDGQVRRYSAEAIAVAGRALKPSATVRSPTGKQLNSLVLNPASDRLAIGFGDSTSVDVLDPETLAKLYTTDPVTDPGVGFNHVAWSADGERLYAGGNRALDGKTILRVWGSKGEAAGRNIILEARQQVVALESCAAGIVFAADDPALGVLDGNDRVRFYQPGVVPDNRGKRGENLLVSADGLRVRFGLDEGGARPVMFDLANELLVSDAERQPDLVGAQNGDLKPEEWIGAAAPKLGGRTIPFEKYENVYSLAAAPERNLYVIGTNWKLRAHDKAGDPLWVSPRVTPGVVWGLDIAPKARLLIAAYGDGTIRWHRLEDGQELLALFVHRIDKRWIAWTPKGYYIASPGAEELIGWHVNRGWKQPADFFPASRFRSEFNRPDVVKLVLGMRDEEKALDRADAGSERDRAPVDVRSIAPPVVRILRPVDGTTFRSQEVVLEYSVHASSGKRISDVDMRINGAALASRAAVPLDPRGDLPMRMSLTLPREDVTITLVAYDGQRASEPAIVHLRWDGAKPGEKPLPRLRALLVGVNAYTARRLPPLQYSVKDAVDLERLLKSEQGRSYSRVDVRLATDATRGDVLEGLEWLEAGSEEDDINLLFLSGHGMTDDNQQYYYMAADSDPGRPRATGVARDEILRTIRNRRGAMVVLLDTCHSGASASSELVLGQRSRVDMNRLVNELGDKTLGVFLYASALGRQLSYEDSRYGKGGNGAFTAAMIEGLSGNADRENVGYVDSEELSLYVRRRVLALTNKRQEPVRMKPDAAPELRLITLR